MTVNEEILNKDALMTQFKSGELRTQEDVENLVKKIMGKILETVLKGELDAHLGYERYDHCKKGTTNRRNGSSSKKVRTNVGKIEVKVARDRENEFTPVLIKPGERELSFFSDQVLSLYSKGMSTRDITGIIHEIYDYDISAETVSKITDRVIAESMKWHERPLEPVYANVFLDGFFCNVRVEGHVRKVCVYVMIGINLYGVKECLGFWTNGSEESAKYWLTVLNEIKNRGVKDILFFCSDNLSGISEAISACFPKALIQKCVVHQIRNSLKYVSDRDRKELSGDLKSIYKAASESDALDALKKFQKKWDSKYPQIGKSWERNWSELGVYFNYSPEIRRLIYTTNPIESVNRGLRKRIKTRSLFPSIDALKKVVYLAVSEINEKWIRAIPDWGLILAQLRIYFDDVLSPYTKGMI